MSGITDTLTYNFERSKTFTGGNKSKTEILVDTIG